MRFSPIRIALQDQTAPVAGEQNILKCAGDSLPIGIFGRGSAPMLPKHANRLAFDTPCQAFQQQRGRPYRQAGSHAFDIAVGQRAAKTITFTQTSIKEDS
ncbi:hypothetical protein DK867_20120 [Ochrobactrum sp. POC9]|nr:hypothetical protein DK867_20120 [Ochrobactrum sp. POC9]